MWPPIYSEIPHLPRDNFYSVWSLSWGGFSGKVELVLELFLEATLVIAVAGTVALSGGFLDWRGAAAGAFIGYLLYLFGGRLHFALVLTFLVVGGFTTRYKYRLKYGEKGRGVRSWTNVLANGGLAALITVISSLYGLEGKVSLALLMGAISAAFTDTMATEVGMLSKSKPVMITNFKGAEPGTPGAVTVLGLAGSLLAPVSIIAVSTLLDSNMILSEGIVSWALLAVVSGFTGSLFDSVVGGLFQSRYRCVECGRVVEVRRHCGKTPQHLSGLKYINNDVVNLLATGYGALVAYALSLYLF